MTSSQVENGLPPVRFEGAMGNEYEGVVSIGDRSREGPQNVGTYPYVAASVNNGNQKIIELSSTSCEDGEYEEIEPDYANTVN